ncbi:MAG: hypothetical protein WCL29_01265 [Pseudomonadota bacterium]
MENIAASKTTKVLLWLLIAVLALIAVSFLMVHLHSVQEWDGGLYLFDQDLSDSVIGWMIGIPVLIVFAIITIAVLMGVGIILAGVVAMVVVIALLSAIFGLLVVVLPFAALLAVPVLIVWGIIRLLSHKTPAPSAHAAAI